MKKCAPKCKTQEFLISGSTASYPKKEYAETFLRNKLQVISKYQDNQSITYDSLKSNIVALDLYYETLDYQIISEVKYTPFLLLVANTGGVFGLFLGMSILSFVEVFDLLIRAVIEIYFKLKINL